MASKQNMSSVSEVAESEQADKCATTEQKLSNDVDIEISVHRTSSVSDFVADTFKIRSIQPLKMIFRSHLWSKDEAVKEKVISKVVSDLVTQLILTSHSKEDSQRSEIDQIYVEINRLIKRIEEKSDESSKLDKELQKRQKEFHRCLQRHVDRERANKQLAQVLQNLEETSKLSIDDVKRKLAEVVVAINENGKEFKKYESARQSMEEIELKLTNRNIDINNKAQKVTELMNTEIPATKSRIKKLREIITVQKVSAEKRLQELNDSKITLQSELDSIVVKISSLTQSLKEQNEKENQLLKLKRCLENEISRRKGIISILNEKKEEKINDEEICHLNRLIEQKMDLIERLKKRKPRRKGGKKIIKENEIAAQNLSNGDVSEPSGNENASQSQRSISPKATETFEKPIESNGSTEDVEI